MITAPSPGTGTEPPSLVQTPPERPIADLVEDLTGSDLLARIVGVAIEPALRIALIVLVAWLLDRLARRLIARTVEEMKSAPGAGQLSALGRRTGLVAEGRVPKQSKRRATRAEALGGLAGSVVAVIIWATAGLMVLGTFGISLAPLVASAGIIGIAVGFGAQDLVKDFLSGVFMLLEDQYGVGDIIDVGDAAGVVEGISLRSTELRSLDGTLWHVPNGEIRRVGNMTQDFSRVILDVAVAYDADLRAAGEVILGAVEAMIAEPPWDEKATSEPELLGVEELGDSGIAIRLALQVAPGAQWATARELRGRIKRALDEAGIAIPFPQRTVWLRGGDAAGGA